MRGRNTGIQRPGNVWLINKRADKPEGTRENNFIFAREQRGLIALEIPMDVLLKLHQGKTVLK